MFEENRDEVKMRPCLGIGCMGKKMFKSLGKWNRKCQKCQNKEAGRVMSKLYEAVSTSPNSRKMQGD